MSRMGQAVFEGIWIGVKRISGTKENVLSSRIICGWEEGGHDGAQKWLWIGSVSEVST